MSTRSSMSLALIRSRPLQFKPSDTSRCDHAGVDQAPGDVILTSGCKDRKNVSCGLNTSLADVASRSRIEFYLCVDSQCCRVWIINSITSLMIAWILLNTSTCVQPPNWLSDVHERLIIASSSKPSRGHSDAIFSQVINEKFLNCSRTRGTCEVECATISIEHAKVTAGDPIQPCQPRLILRKIQTHMSKFKYANMLLISEALRCCV